MTPLATITRRATDAVSAGDFKAATLWLKERQLLLAEAEPHDLAQAYRYGLVLAAILNAARQRMAAEIEWLDHAGHGSSFQESSGVAVDWPDPNTPGHSVNVSV